jgi:hypothetical protein
MSKSKATTTPAPQTTPTPEPKFLQQARAHFARHFNPVRDAKEEREQEVRIQAYARELAIYSDPIGRLAGRFCDMAGELRDALEEFERLYPNREAIEAATLAAIRNAGLQEPGPCAAAGRCTFTGLSGEAKGWALMLNVMRNLMEGFLPPEELEDEDTGEPEDVADDQEHDESIAVAATEPRASA